MQECVVGPFALHPLFLGLAKQRLASDGIVDQVRALKNRIMTNFLSPYVDFDTIGKIANFVPKTAINETIRPYIRCPFICSRIHYLLQFFLPGRAIPQASPRGPHRHRPG